MRLFHALALPGRRRAAAGRPVPGQAPAPGLAGGGRADARAGRVRPAQGPRLRGDDRHLGRRGRADHAAGTRFRVRHDRDHAALGDLAGAAARRGRAGIAAAVATWARRAIRRSARSRPETGRPAALAAGADHTISTITMAWLPLGVHLLELGTLLAIAYVIFRPLAAPRALAEPGRARRWPPSSCARTAPTRWRSSSCGPTSTTSSARTGGRSSATRSRTACCCCPAIPSGPPDAIPGPASRGARVRRGRGLKLGALGASAAAVPAVRGARAADDLPGRRGGRRAEPLLARGPPDPQGAPVGHPPEQGGLQRRAAASCAALDQATLEQVEAVLELGRQGAPERGFSMAMDSLQGRARRRHARRAGAR